MAKAYGNFTNTTYSTSLEIILKNDQDKIKVSYIPPNKNNTATLSSEDAKKLKITLDK